jgi:hypothetical protein
MDYNIVALQSSTYEAFTSSSRESSAKVKVFKGNYGSETTTDVTETLYAMLAKCK